MRSVRCCKSPCTCEKMTAYQERDEECAVADREELLMALVREVLGPRGGPTEVLPTSQDPRSEYITGVLAPREAPVEDEDSAADVQQLVEETYSDEDQGAEAPVVVPQAITPALNPKSLPRSIGLSFIVRSDDQPELEVAATWARYGESEDGWCRRPEGFQTGPISGDHGHAWEIGRGVSMSLVSRRQANGDYRLSVYLVNTTELAHRKPPTTQDHVFQPQLRVRLLGSTRLVPGAGRSGANTAEDRGLDLTYRNRPALARGHLCGAVWASIDPERHWPGAPPPMEAPFAWTDELAIPEADRARFAPCHVRTDFVPIYPVQIPDLSWDARYGTSPILDPGELAEMWDATSLDHALRPLTAGYAAWVHDQEVSAAAMETADREIADGHLATCRSALGRIDHAIALLTADPDVRLAFCFANRAMDLQSAWKGRHLVWRPFQLAFILLNIGALAEIDSADRGICDLLWIPTGGGKTEAYLGLTAFVLALRRLRAPQTSPGHGVSVLSRYTLRLLTIQQFRRAMGVITACEVLRTIGLNSPGTSVGWRPKACEIDREFLWGTGRFAAGLWVGGGVTPNNMFGIGPIPAQGGALTYIAGAIDILQGAERGYSGPNARLARDIRMSSNLRIDGEPAQMLNCPCCQSLLAVPDAGLKAGEHELHLVFHEDSVRPADLASLNPGLPQLELISTRVVSLPTPGYHTLSLRFKVSVPSLAGRQIDDWWLSVMAPALGSPATLSAARPSRPGYFILTYDNSLNNSHACDFDIYCPNPDCDLNCRAWAEQVPLRRDSPSIITTGRVASGHSATPETNALPVRGHNQWQLVPEPFRWNGTPPGRCIGRRIPISALTVDDQIYHRCPSLVIATVDKFARLAYEGKAATIFGNVSHYHARWGYYREGCPPSENGPLPSVYSPHPRVAGLHVPIEPLAQPDLILQDELHLIEGPLGSMVGLYETAIDILCSHGAGDGSVRPKYIASTATVREAERQVQGLFDRSLAQFPPAAILADERFFVRDREVHPLDATAAGRLYVGICAPGRGAQTPIVRIWSRLLQSIWDSWQASHDPHLDNFWTLVGYFNAIRELAGALSLYRQDIPERMEFVSPGAARPLEEHMELSGRSKSLDLPSMLDELTVSIPDGRGVVLATSMFGTGVDVDRLGLMVVHGQPKTAAAYIQATGRVGRQSGGLVISFLRASRPRDLDHYEFFTGYHRALYRQVEPITVAPFSPRAREVGLGPLAVVLLRNAGALNGQPVAFDWRIQQRISGAYHARANRMAGHRRDPEVETIPILLEQRAQRQPVARAPVAGATADEAASELDRWSQLAATNNDTNRFVYHESAYLRQPERDVVLGDAQHRNSPIVNQAYSNAPNSLREVEETTGFKI